MTVGSIIWGERKSGGLGGNNLIFNLFINFISAVALLLFVLLTALLFTGLRDASAERLPLSAAFEPFGRLVDGSPGDRRPPHTLYLACLALLAVFLLVPMGSLPQFLDTPCDFCIGMLLLIVAQSLYINGIKDFSGNAYQSLDRKVVYALSRFAAAFVAFGGTMSWYILQRGIPGDIFSLNAVAALPIYSVMGTAGRLGLFCFLLLFAVESPGSRHKDLEYGSAAGAVPILEVFDAVRLLIAPAIAAAAIVPWNFGLKAGIFGGPMYAVDFVIFWIKVLLLQAVVFPLISKFFDSLKEKTPLPKGLFPSLPLGILGVLLIMSDLYI